MDTIYKYPLDWADSQVIQIPEGAKILSAQIQRDRVCIWALVNPQARIAPRSFRIHGTGHSVENSKVLKFIDTVQHYNGTLVFHVFEEIQ